MKSIRIVSLFIFSLICLGTYAKKVPFATAQKVASHLVRSFAAEAGINNDASMLPVFLKSDDEDGKPLYYVYGFSDHPGYIMVSATDLVMPVLCYSFTHAWQDIDQIQSPETKFWMKTYRDILKSTLTSNNAEAKPEVSLAWETMQETSPPKTASFMPTYVAPLLTTQWGQGCGYNYSLLPCSENCLRVLTGCVATAMAQLMKYWNYPVHGQGPDCDEGDAGTICSDFNTNYAWGAMNDNCNSGICDEISVLMRDCGIGVHMDYGCNSSSANSKEKFVPCLVDHFFYDTDAHYEQQEDHPYEQWVEALKLNLLSKYPVVYRGNDGSEGHAWVLDGYHFDAFVGATFYHFNWGWTGQYDDWYLLDVMDPQGQTYNIDLGAFLDLHPADWAQPTSPINIKASAGTFTDHVKVNWHWAANATHYKVYRCTNPANPADNTPLTDWITGTEYNDYDVVPGQTFYYIVTSKSTNLGGIESAITSISNAGTVAAPFNLNNLGYMAACPDSADYYNIWTSNSNKWIAFAVHSHYSSTNTSLTSYPNFEYSNPAGATAYSESGPGKTALIMYDAIYCNQAIGFATHKLGQESFARIQALQATQELVLDNYNNITWPANNLVNVWQLYLNPGRYFIRCEVVSGNIDPGIALFKPVSGQNYLTMNQSMGYADANSLGGNESICVTVGIAGWYGLVMWTNTLNLGTFNLKMGNAGRWTGEYDDNWHNPLNWVGNYVPTSSDDVVIPENAYYFPRIYQANATCRNIVIAADENITATLTIANHSLTVLEKTEIFGELILSTNNSSTKLITYNLNWEAGSSFSTTEQAGIHCQHTWEFKPGANINLYNGVVYFDGDGSAEIRCMDANSSFNNIYIDKPNYQATFSEISTNNLLINGYLTTTANSTFLGLSDKSIVLDGAFNNNGHVQCWAGNFILEYEDKDIIMDDGDYFHNLELGYINLVTFLTDVTIKGSLHIDYGYPHLETLSDNTIYLKGNWINENGADGYSSTGTVVFNGYSDQYCSNENFDHLLIDKPAGDLVINGTAVSCIHYSCNVGRVYVLSGSFNTDHLDDNGISGAFVVQEAGVVNLHNPGGWVDLNGGLEIYGGTVNVYGGTTDSYWPYANDGYLIMTGGTLDFKETGIFLYPGGSHIFVGDISGGTIRTTGSFRADGYAFQADGGYIELYGPGSAVLSAINNSQLANVTVDKSLIAAYQPDNLQYSNPHPEEPLSDSPQFQAPNIVGPQVNLNSNISMKGHLVINNGTLHANSYNITLRGYWINNVGLSGFDCGSGTVKFNSSFYDQQLYTADSYEQFNNLEIQAYTRSFIAYQALHVSGNFHAFSGTIAASTPTDTWHEIAGNFIVDPAVSWNSGFGNISFNGSTEQILQFSPSSGQLANVYIYKPQDVELLQYSNVSSAPDANLIVYSGTLDLNGYMYDCEGNVSIWDGANIYMPGNSSLMTGSGKTLSIKNGGMLQTRGGENNLCYLQSGQGYFKFDVEAGGTLSADYCMFMYMDTNGVNIMNGAFIDQWYPMNNCMFVFGQDGGSLLTVNNSQTLTVDKASFISDNSSSNVKKGLNQGMITFTNYGGGFGGEQYDNDPFNLINWLGGTAINGTLRYANSINTPLNNTLVILKNGNTVLDSVLTDASGHYSFTGIPYGNLSLRARCTKPWGGANAVDALLVLKHFVGLVTLSDLAHKAADVNQSGAVNSLDALLISKRFAGIITYFLNENDSCNWVFDNPVVAINGPGNYQQDINGLCYGDVNKSYIPTARIEPAVILEQHNFLAVDPSQEIWIPIFVTEDLTIGSVSLVLNYPDNISVRDVKMGDAASSAAIFNITDKEVRISWYSLYPMVLKAGEMLCSLKIRTDGSDEAVFSVSPESILSDENALTFEKTILSIPSLLSVHQDVYSLGCNAPNPFDDITTIPYYLTEEGLVQLKIFNMLGDQVAVLAENLLQQSGPHEFMFSRGSLAPGIYLYKLEVEGKNSSFSKSNKMIAK